MCVCVGGYVLLNIVDLLWLRINAQIVAITTHNEKFQFYFLLLLLPDRLLCRFLETLYTSHIPLSSG
jgi:hypothetical protein